MLATLRVLLLASAALIHFGAAAQTQAQAPAAAAPYPSKPIRLIVPFPPGGSVDPVARLLAERLAAGLGQPVVIDNRGGANTTLGTAELTKAAPDGHTLLLTASTHVINPLLGMKLPYDSVKDFLPVATVIRSEFMLVAHPSLPANSLAELVALAKSQPGKLNYAISGTGNANHLAGELFNQVAQVKLTNIPYKGGGPAINDLLGGQVQLMFSVPTSVVQHVRAGRLKAFAYTGATPLPGVTVPSFAQAGLPQFDMNSWQGIMVPAGTPKAVIDRLSEEIGKVLATPDVREKLASQGQDPFISTPEQFEALLKRDRDKYDAIIRTANIKAE
jgi:tripartite-type tricarboxylate transporter receptor subunit TctC